MRVSLTGVSGVPVMVVSWLRLSSGFSTGCPTIAPNVARKSMWLMSWSETVPAGMCPGQRMIMGMRWPPSQAPNFDPSSLPLMSCPFLMARCPSWLSMPPLSLVKMRMVLSTMFSFSRVSMIWPVIQSSSWVKSPYRPALLVPTNCLSGVKGWWMLVVERSRKKGFSLSRCSIHLMERSVRLVPILSST